MTPTHSLAVISLLMTGMATAGPFSLRESPDGKWTLLRDDREFSIKGVGGSIHLDELVEAGGNTIRTWGVDNLVEKVDGKSLVERARRLDLAISAGLWVGHERHGFRYDDPAQLARQRREIRAAVARWKTEPTIGLWGLGNEMEASGANIAIWKELEILAGIVKSEDPTRPVMTVIAGAAPEKIAAINTHCPGIDILGVNAYAAAPGVARSLRDAGWKKPFVLSEFGPRGHWEVAKTPWGAPLEPSSREKAENYRSVHRGVLEEAPGHCLGTFAFLWGQKQERTPTWYGMFLKSGEKLPPVDAMTHEWRGRWPSNRCPDVKSFESSAKGGTVSPGAAIEVSLAASDPDGDPLEFRWAFAPESTDHKAGGDAEKAPPKPR